jgi:hypothetical protein
MNGRAPVDLPGPDSFQPGVKDVAARRCYLEGEADAMKVYKSVGAVAIYSPARAATIAAGAVALLAGAGFAAGLVASDSGGSSSGPSAPLAARTAPAPQGASPKGVAVRAAYRRGVRSGVASVVGDPRGLAAGSAYLVRLGPGRGAAPFTIGPRVTVEAGRTYSLCSNGQHICMKQGGLAGAP